MRRGYMSWNADDLPLDVLTDRISRLQMALAEADLSGMVVYTSFPRPAAVSYLTGFTPYWSQGILFVPVQGEPILANALSNRVRDWIRSVMPVGEIIMTPQPGKVIGELLADRLQTGRIGVLEMPDLPNAILRELCDFAPGVSFVDSTGLFRNARRRDDTEDRLTAQINLIVEESLDKETRHENEGATDLAGAVEKSIRLAGAEEVYVSIAPDLARERIFTVPTEQVALGDLYAVRVSAAYKGSWIRHTRTLARSKNIPLLNSTQERFESFAQNLVQEKPLREQVEAFVSSVAGAHLVDWVAESCIGTYPLEPVAGTSERVAASPSGPIALSVHLEINGIPCLVARTI